MRKLVLLILILAGCAGPHTEPTEPQYSPNYNPYSPDHTWRDPASDWRTNMPSFDPVTNIILEPEWGPIPPPSNWTNR